MATPNTTERTTQKAHSTQNTDNQQRTQRPQSAQGAPSGSATEVSPDTDDRARQQQAAAAEPRGGQAAAGRGTDAERAQQVPISREGERESRQQSARGGSPMARRVASGGLAPFGAIGNPFALMYQLQSEMDRLFEDFGFGRSLLSPVAAPPRTTRTGGGTGMTRQGMGQGAGQALWSPQLDVFRRGDELVVRADLPGLAKDDVTVDLEEGVLTIRGERRQDAQEDREGYYWSERSYGGFERSIALPEGIDESQAKASFRDGVLEVTLPAPKPEERRARRIEIR
jgi:HSP20 family protein